MKIIENFVRPVTVEQLNGELSGIGAQLIDVVQAGPESLMLYFDHVDGAADCLRLSAQRGPQGAPTLAVETCPLRMRTPSRSQQRACRRPTQSKNKNPLLTADQEGTTWAERFTHGSGGTLPPPSIPHFGGKTLWIL